MWSSGSIGCGNVNSSSGRARILLRSFTWTGKCLPFEHHNGTPINPLEQALRAPWYHAGILWGLRARTGPYTLYGLMRGLFVVFKVQALISVPECLEQVVTRAC